MATSRGDTQLHLLDSVRRWQVTGNLEGKTIYSLMKLCRSAGTALDNAGKLPRGKADDWRTTSRVGINHSLRLALGLSGSMPARRASTEAAASWVQDICTVVSGGSMNCAR